MKQMTMIKRAMQKAEADKIVNEARVKFMNAVSGTGATVSKMGQGILQDAYGSLHRSAKTVKGAKTLAKQIEADTKKVLNNKERAMTRAINKGIKSGSLDESYGKKLKLAVQHYGSNGAIDVVRISGEATFGEDWYDENKDFLNTAKDVLTEYKAYQEAGEPIPTELQHLYDEIKEAGSDISWIDEFDKPEDEKDNHRFKG